MTMKKILFLTILLSILGGCVTEARRGGTPPTSTVNENPIARLHHHHHPFRSLGWGLDEMEPEDPDYHGDRHKAVRPVKVVRMTNKVAVKDEETEAAKKKHEEMLRGIVQAYMDNLMYCGLE